MNLTETIALVTVPQAALPLQLLTWAREAPSWLRAHPMAATVLLAAAFGGIEHHHAQNWAIRVDRRGASLPAIHSGNAAASGTRLGVGGRGLAKRE